MMKKIISLFILFFFSLSIVNAQEIKRHKIAIFTPLYLDSAFDAGGNFRYEKTGARFVNAGLDFYYFFVTAEARKVLTTSWRNLR